LVALRASDGHPYTGKSGTILAIDEARFLLGSRVCPGEVTAEKVGDFLMDLLQAFVEVDLLEETRAGAIRIFRSLPRDEAALERFAQTGREEPLLRSLADALSKRFAQGTV